MAGVVLDSSVVIALFKPNDKHHLIVKAAVATEQESLSVSTITIAEALVRPAQVSQKEAVQKAGLLRQYFGDSIPVTREVAELAAFVRANTGLAIPDAIISATATITNAELWTCDVALANAHKGARLIA